MENVARSLTENSPVASSQAWQLSDRLDWALSLPVPPPARFVAVALIKHTNSVTGLTCPAVSTLVKLTGYSKATVKTAIRQLEQGGHYDITRLKVGKVNVVNRYRANRVGVGQELPQGGSGADPEPVREPVNVQEVQQRTLTKLSETPLKLAKTGRSKLRSSPHTAQQRMVAAIAVKLDLTELLTASGLESFDDSPNSDKQALIKRLLRVEAWHDRRATAAANAAHTERIHNETGGQKAPTAANAAPRPLTPEAREELEVLAVERDGYRKRDGKWVKAWL